MRAKAIAFWRLRWREEERDEDVTFLGLVMLWDPPRPEVPEALQRAKAAGIRVVMITGDHPATAKAVGEAIGITTERVVTGSEVEQASSEQLRELVRHVNVFARVAPEHKLRLVEALKDNGEIVAVTGDGVNDAPALKRSDVGVAMGQRGSDVSREVSDVVLLDDNFATIVAAIEEGRSIYENIQKFIRFFFSTDLALIVLMIAGLAPGLPARHQGPDRRHVPVAADRRSAAVDQCRGRRAARACPGLRPQPRRDEQAAAAAELETARCCLAALHRHQRHGEGRWRHRLPRRHAATRLLARRDADIRVPLRIHDAAGLCLSRPGGSAWCHCPTSGYTSPSAWAWRCRRLTVVLPPLRALLGLVPVSAAVFAAIMVAVLLTWAVAEFLGRPAASVPK